MGLELRPSINIRQEPKLQLSLEQRQQLEQILALQLQLKHPEFPEAVRGLEGMMDADAVLKEKNAHGVLIGGLAVEIWKKEATHETFHGHKDVDVMVVSPEAGFDQFEGGVDWWIPQKHIDDSRYPRSISYTWTNGNNVQLKFGALYQKPRTHSPLPAGLYLPDPKYVVEITKLTLLERFKEEHPDEDIDIDVDTEIENKLEEMFTEEARDAYPQSEMLNAVVKEKFDKSRVNSVWSLGTPKPARHIH